MSSPMMTASPHLLVSAKKGRSVCLLILCTLVWDFFKRLTLVLYWLESMEAPMDQFQSFSINRIYETLNCLTFSFLGTQFIKPNPT